MTDLSDLLAPEAVLAGSAPASKKALFAGMGAAAATAYGLQPKLVADRLTAREKLGSTGFGAGVAIPHARIEGLERIVGGFALLAQPLEFGAVDDLPVDIVFMLLSPEDAGPEHLKALARVSRRLRDRPFLAKLRGAGSRDALYALLTEGDTRDAA
jgi:nitrogen PTS system EIIA component